jgi:serine phosphatase RsbU (regulator of sigma subunit)
VHAGVGRQDLGDVVGHDLTAAAAMSQTRSMLRALLYDRGTPASGVLAQLDHTLHAITENPVTTACLARIESAEPGWDLCWSTAGHPPPLLLVPGREPGRELGQGLGALALHKEHQAVGLKPAVDLGDALECPPLPRRTLGAESL